MKNISIYGIGGIYNYGCEAIVRGTVEYIRKKYGRNAEITYYSRIDSEEEKKLANELKIKLFLIKRKYNFFQKVILKLIDIFRIPVVPFLNNEFSTVINNSDIIFSVGGDIYTIPKTLRNKKKYRYVNQLVEFGEKALNANKKIIIYGASIGPFGNYAKAINYYTKHFQKVNLIICREQETKEYLSQIGIKENVEFLPDPAFLVPDIKEKFERKYIGINLSKLSIYEVYGELSQPVLNNVCNFINNVYSENKLPIMLIPHVYSFNEIDNDYLFLKKVYENLNDEAKQNTILINNKSFIDTKKYLKQCKVVIAARMHCAVNAITSNIPAIFISYSQKSKGMCKFIYGSEKWCVQLDEIKNGLERPIKEMINNLETIDQYLIQRNSEIKDLYEDYFKNNMEEDIEN